MWEEEGVRVRARARVRVRWGRSIITLDDRRGRESGRCLARDRLDRLGREDRSGRRRTLLGRSISLGLPGGRASILPVGSASGRERDGEWVWVGGGSE